MGLMAATTCVTPFACLRMRSLQHWMSRMYRPSWKSLPLLITLCQNIIVSLDWWLVRTNALRCVQFNPLGPSWTVTSEASTGVGESIWIIWQFNGTGLLRRDPCISVYWNWELFTSTQVIPPHSKKVLCKWWWTIHWWYITSTGRGCHLCSVVHRGDKSMGVVVVFASSRGKL